MEDYTGLVWGLFSFVTAVVASKRKRNGFHWFVYSLLLGPFGPILVLALPLGEKAQSQKVVRKRCPFCAESILAQAIVCRYCGRDMPDSPLARQTATRSSRDEDEQHQEQQR